MAEADNATGNARFFQVVRIMRSELDAARDWARLLHDVAPRLTAAGGPGITVLKSHGPSAVWRLELGGQDVIVKRWDIRGPWSKLKMLTRTSRAHRQWHGARTLAGASFGATPVLALVHEIGRGAWREWLIARTLPGKSVLEHLWDRDLSVRASHSVAHEIGDQVARLIRAGLFNRDHKGANIIVTSAKHDRATLALVDTVAIRRAHAFNKASCARRMFATLTFEALGYGILPRRTLRLRALHAFARAALGPVPLARGAGGQGRGFPQRSRLVSRLAKLLWARIELDVRSRGDPDLGPGPLMPHGLDRPETSGGELPPVANTTRSRG